MPRPRSTTKRERAAWRTAIRRCTDPKFKDFPRYGGAGIKVCLAWRESFNQFLEDMGPATTQAHWLGRLDVTKGYFPGNCLWTEQPPQERRRTFCRRVTLSGETMTAAEAARALGMNRDTLVRRVVSGFQLENPPAAKLYRASKWLTFNGETLPLPEWARRIGLPSPVIISRINRGMPVELALTPRLFRNRKAPAGP